MKNNKEQVELSVINPGPDDVIVFRFNLAKHSQEDLAAIAKGIKQHYPDNFLIGIPTDCEVKAMNKDWAITWLTGLINDLKEDN